MEEAPPVLVLLPLVHTGIQPELLNLFDDHGAGVGPGCRLGGDPPRHLWTKGDAAERITYGVPSRTVVGHLTGAPRDRGP